MRRVMTLVLAAACSATLGLSAQQPLDPNRWESAIQKFEAEDKANPPAKGGIVFIGASSIVRWTNLAESFPDLKVVNSGFGGSEMSESARYAPRAVVPHAPRIVVLYPGENDLDRGLTPEAIAADFFTFATTVRTALPATRIVVIGLKPSLLRWKLRDEMHQTNKLIRSRCASDRNCVYVDPWPSMIGADGKPKPEFFVEDGLHMTPEGYKVWTADVAAAPAIAVLGEPLEFIDAGSASEDHLRRGYRVAACRREADSGRTRLGQRHDRDRARHQSRSRRRRHSRRRAPGQAAAAPPLFPPQQAARLCHHAIGSRAPADRSRSSERRARIRLSRRSARFRLGRPADSHQRRRPRRHAHPSQTRSRARVRSAGARRARRARRRSALDAAS